MLLGFTQFILILAFEIVSAMFLCSIQDTFTAIRRYLAVSKVSRADNNYYKSLPGENLILGKGKPFVSQHDRRNL